MGYFYAGGLKGLGGEKREVSFEQKSDDFFLSLVIRMGALSIVHSIQSMRICILLLKSISRSNG